jgi:hypothetical protein
MDNKNYDAEYKPGLDLTVDRILNKRRSNYGNTNGFQRTTTPEPRSIMHTTGQNLMDSRIQNVRSRI